MRAAMSRLRGSEVRYIRKVVEEMKRRKNGDSPRSVELPGMYRVY